MRYIKSFEKNSTLYNIDDYVLLDLQKIDDYNKSTKSSSIPIRDPFVKILQTITDDDVMPYRIEFYNDDYYRVKDQEIIRKLTPEEIENFETRRKAIKYNL